MISGQDGVSRARIVALTGWPFELFPLNELYRGTIVRSITHTLRDISMLFGIHVYQAKTVCRVQEWLLFHAGL